MGLECFHFLKFTCELHIHIAIYCGNDKSALFTLNKDKNRIQVIREYHACYKISPLKRKIEQFETI